MSDSYLMDVGGLDVAHLTDKVIIAPKNRQVAIPETEADVAVAGIDEQPEDNIDKAIPIDVRIIWNVTHALSV